MNSIAFEVFLFGLVLAAGLAAFASRFLSFRALPPSLFTFTGILGLMTAGVSLVRGQTVQLDISARFPFPVAFTIDRLSAFFLVIICAVSVPAAIFSFSYVRAHYHDHRFSWYWSLLSLFVLSMVIVVTSSTVYAFMLGWELMTLTSAGLIVLEGAHDDRRHNLFIYLLMMHAGAAAVLAAFFIFVPHSGGMTFAAIRSVAPAMPSSLRTAVFVLAFAGFGAKAGIIPLHLWLPKAHPIAPSPISALMSGVMLKTAVYGFVRFSFDFLGAPPLWWGYLALAAGAISGVLGVLYALGEHDLKRLLAYHSVENIGIIYLGLGTSLIFLSRHSSVWAALALAAALLHTLNHALFKSLLFLGAGAIHHSTHTLDMEELGGLARRMPILSAAFLVGCCAIVGLPLFNGFVSEWLTYRGFVAGAVFNGSSSDLALPMMVGVLALIGSLAAACFVKVYGITFLARPRTVAAEQAQDVPPSMSLAVSLLGAVCVLIGIFPGIALQPLTTVVSAVIPGAGAPPEIAMISRVMPVAGASILGIVLLTMTILWTKKLVRIVPTWACGLSGLSPRMQYAAASFSKPIRQVFHSVYRPDRRVEVLPADRRYFPETISYHSVRTTSYERALYRPAVDLLVSAARGLRRLHTGNIQAYLLYIFLMLLSLLLYLRFSQ